MRNTLLLLALTCFAASITFAQDEQPLSRTVFKLSPQHFIHNSLKAGIERFNADHSGSFAVFITGRMENNREYIYDREGYNGMAGEVQFRKYISPMKLRTSRKNNTFHQGIYGAAYIQGGTYSGGFEDNYSVYDPNTGTYAQTYYRYTERITNGGVGFTIGYQKTLWQVIFLEAFVGGGVQFSDINISGNRPEDPFYYYSGITDPSYRGILPKIGLHIGIAL